MTQEDTSLPKSEEPDWKAVFADEKVFNVENVDVGYENANDIWKVLTERGEYVVKITRTDAQEENHPFWHALGVVFGLDLHDDFEYQRKLANFINSYSPLKIPLVRHIAVESAEIEKPYTVVECVPGATANLADNPNANAIARQLGEHLGGLHRGEFDYWGTFSGSTKYDLSEWGARLADSMETLAQGDFGDKPEVRARLNEFRDKAEKLAPPESGALVFPDLRPSQFMQHDGRLSALVDIESHVVAPRELDLVAIEYSLETAEQTAEFTAGYEKFLPLPDLSPVRDVYRFLYFLVNILGETDLDKWMSHERKF